MIINKRRIRNVGPYINHFNEGSRIVVGVVDIQRYKDILDKVGFSEPYLDGQTLLPSGAFGPISVFNSEGKELVNKDLPKETAYRQAEWSWDQWNGPYETIRRSKIVDVPYERYPRTFIDPPSVEFTVKVTSDGRTMIVTPAIENKKSNIQELTHVINLFLEIFGECQLLTEKLDDLSKTKTVRLNWQILPIGEIPWPRFKTILKPLIEQAPKGNRPVLEYRLKVVDGFGPDFRAIGRGGFHGYIVHGFTKKNLYVLESLYYGNATYVFGEKWEDLSKMTKAEIINSDLQLDRIIHHKGWRTLIANLIESRKEVDDNAKK